jgi:aminopeptidase 2
MLQYDIVVNAAENAKTSDERNTALRALGRAKSPELIQRTLAYSISEHVKGQDIYLPISALRTHKEGIEALWTWVKDNWAELERRLPPSLSMLSSVVSICTSSFTHREHIKDIEDFFANKSTKGFDKLRCYQREGSMDRAGFPGCQGLVAGAWLSPVVLGPTVKRGRKHSTAFWMFVP